MSNKNNGAIKFISPEEEVVLDGEPKLLNIVILNICLNAIHASGGTGEININVEKNRNWAVCTIEDSGTGISKKEIEMIFDPFFTTKRGHKGYGLGLAVSKGIIERHNGKISVKSYHGKGTIVSIRLKLSKKK
jgi:signal transduction histidine kinase